MQIKIDTSEIDKAAKKFGREVNRSMAGAINTTFETLHKEAARKVPVAKKADINRFAKSVLAQKVAKKHMKGRYVKGIPASKQIEMYIAKMVEAKRGATRFTRLLVNAAYIKSRGGTPRRPGGVRAEGRKASNSGNYLNAWVRIQYTFKRGGFFRRNIEEILNKAYSEASAGIVKKMEEKAAKAIERAAKKSGLK